MSLWLDEGYRSYDRSHDRSHGNRYPEVEYKRIIAGVESGKVPENVWLYRYFIDQIKGLGIEDQIRKIIDTLQDDHDYTIASIASAVGIDEISISRFMNCTNSLELRSVDLIVRHFAIVLTPLAWITRVPYFDEAAGKRKGRNDKGKKRKNN